MNGALALVCFLLFFVVVGLITFGICEVVFKIKEKKRYITNLEERNNYSAFFKKHDKIYTITTEMNELNSKGMKIEKEIDKLNTFLVYLIPDSIQYDECNDKILELQTQYEALIEQNETLIRQKKLLISTVKEFPIPPSYEDHPWYAE